MPGLKQAECLFMILAVLNILRSTAKTFLKVITEEKLEDSSSYLFLEPKLSRSFDLMFLVHF